MTITLRDRNRVTEWRWPFWRFDWLLIVTGAAFMAFGIWAQTSGYEGGPPKSAIQDMEAMLYIGFGLLSLGLGAVVNTMRHGFNRLCAYEAQKAEASAAESTRESAESAVEHALV